MKYMELINMLDYEINKAITDICFRYQTENNVQCKEPTEAQANELNIATNHLVDAVADLLISAKPTTKIYEKPYTECFYTGGGYWCTIYQLGGKMSDYYYAICSEDENGTMCLYSHKADTECNNDEFAFYGVIRYIDIKTATEAEKAIYYAMAEEEEKTLKENGCFSEAYKR